VGWMPDTGACLLLYAGFFGADVGCRNLQQKQTRCLDLLLLKVGHGSVKKDGKYPYFEPEGVLEF
jgi:hypothetical protein